MTLIRETKRRTCTALVSDSEENYLYLASVPAAAVSPDCSCTGALAHSKIHVVVTNELMRSNGTATTIGLVFAHRSIEIFDHLCVASEARILPSTPRYNCNVQKSTEASAT